MLGNNNNTKRIFAGLSNGKVTVRPGKDQEPILYDFIEGRITEIKKSDRSVKDKDTKFIDLTIVDGEDTVILSLYEDSTSTRSLLLALASVKDFSQKIRISAYPRSGANGVVFTNVALYSGGQKLPWAYENSQIPKVTTEIYKGQEIKDASERNAFFEKLYNSIANAINAAAAGDRPAVDYDEYDHNEPDEDMPEA